MLRVKFKGLLEEAEKRRDYSSKALELIEKLPKGTVITIEKGSLGNYDIFNDEGTPEGEISIEPVDPNSSGVTPSFYRISNSMADRGWGALFYDIALEVASLVSGGLVSDRFEVSDDARAVWEKYFKNRPDVVKVRTDVDVGSEEIDDAFEGDLEDNKKPTDYIAQVTPKDPKDDLIQVSALKHKGFEGFLKSQKSDDEKFKEWSRSPLSYAYKKKGAPVLKALKARGALDGDLMDII